MTDAKLCPREPTQITNDSREAFEQLQRSRPGFVSFDMSTSNGRYWNNAIQDQWEAWQAALAWADAARAPAAEPPHCDRWKKPGPIHADCAYVCKEAEPPQGVAATIARLNADADAWMFHGGQHIQSCRTTADLEREAAAALAALQARIAELEGRK